MKQTVPVTRMRTIPAGKRLRPRPRLASAWFGGSLAKQRADLRIRTVRRQGRLQTVRRPGLHTTAPVSARPLDKCPACKRPVEKIISSFNTSILKPLSISDAKKAGFTVLKKTSKGEYERQ